MNRRRAATAVVLGLRIAYGAGLVAAPGRLTGRWLGPAPDSATRVAIRGLGAREIALHCAALHAAFSGRPLRPWLMASMAGDLSDIAATAAARDGLPDRSPTATLVVAGASALATAGLASRAPC
jgi:hypothetical protein